MTEQLSLIPEKKVRVAAQEVAAFVAWLGAQDGWRTAHEVNLAIGCNDRQCRALKAAAQGAVISGQHGYRLTHLATLEEIAHAAAWLRSQAREMDAAARDIERVRHCFPRGSAVSPASPVASGPLLSNP